MSFRADAEHWKATSKLRPDAARAPGPVHGRGSYEYRLPIEYAKFRQRNDAEAINRALDDTLYLPRAHSLGHRRPPP